MFPQFIFVLKPQTLFMPIYISIRYLGIHGTRVTATNSTNKNVVFFFVSDFKIV